VPQGEHILTQEEVQRLATGSAEMLRLLAVVTGRTYALTTVCARCRRARSPKPGERKRGLLVGEFKG
jgi:hypothetical protein